MSGDAVSTIRTRKCRHCKGTGVVPEAVHTGAEMRRRREKAGMGLREMARRIGFAPSYLGHLEAGRRAWSDDMVCTYNDAIEAIS